MDVIVGKKEAFRNISIKLLETVFLIQKYMLDALGLCT